MDLQIELTLGLVMLQCCFRQVSHHHIAMETGRNLSADTLANEQELILNNFVS